MFKKIALATALIASFSAAHATQYEVNAAYEKTDMELGTDADTYAINGKYFLSDLTAKGPLAEAGFLGKVSNIGLGYANTSMDEEGAELDIDTFGVRGEFFIPNSQFYVSGSVNQTKLSVETPVGSDDADNTGYSLEVGYLPVDGLLVAIGATDENYDSTAVAKQGFINSFTSLAAGDDDTAVTLRAKYVGEIGSHFVNFEGASVFGDETSYRLGADLYLDDTFSVGVSFADTTVEDTDAIYSVNAQKFFTQNFAAGLNYTTTDNVDAYGLTATFRF